MTGWLRADEAAVLLGTTVGNVHVIAHRLGWHRTKRGRLALYAADDVWRAWDNRQVSETPATAANGPGA